MSHQMTTAEIARYFNSPSASFHDAFSALEGMRRIRESIERGDFLASHVREMLTAALVEADKIKDAMK